jgi:hypothetical protein
MNVADESVTAPGIEPSISIAFYPDRTAYRLYLRYSRNFQQNVRRRYRSTLLSSLLYRIISEGSIEFIYKKTPRSSSSLW